MPDKYPEAEKRRITTQGAMRLEELKGIVAKLAACHLEVSEMMLRMTADGLGAMRYGQYGGSFPDPTAGAVFDVHGDPKTAVRWRDHKPENDLADYDAGIERAYDELVNVVDIIRRRYMSANNNIRDRLDPAEFCTLHFAMHLYEGHRRVKGNLCRVCAAFYDLNGREPTNTEIDHWHRKGSWPSKLYDPKERKAV